jgi:hypothetical protein
MPMRFLFKFPTLQQLCSELNDLRDANLRDQIARGGNEIDELLERVASMSDNEVERVVRELSAQGRAGQ